MFCYDLDGNLLWQRDFGSYRMFGGWGTASSPALDGDRLFILCDNEEKSFLITLDTRTGAELWRVSREEKSSWSTPYVWRNQLRTEVVAVGGRYIRSYDPQTGGELWRLAVSSATGMVGSSKASPIGTEELLYVGFGSRASGAQLGPFWAIKVGASGTISTASENVAWYREDSGPVLATPLLYQDLLYIVPRDGNTLYCLNAKTGEEVYRQKLSGATGFKASPWAAAGKVFILAEDGDTFVVAAGPEFALLGVNRLDETSWASPAVSEGEFFVRTTSHLLCITQSQ